MVDSKGGGQVLVCVVELAVIPDRAPIGPGAQEAVLHHVAELIEEVSGSGISIPVVVRFNQPVGLEPAAR